MACTNCTPLPVASFVFNGTSPCTNCDDSECPNGVISSKCVYNDGPPLLCIEADANERLDSILQKIDTKLCTVVGGNPYPGYNTYCLGPMANQQQFVETISDAYCTLQSDYNTFVSTTYPAQIAAISAQIAALDLPNISSCVAIGFAPTDTLKVAITKLANYACNLQTQLDVSSVNWSQCAVVSPVPATIQQGFDFLVDQICNINAGGSASLPTFDNTGTCLDTPTTTDTLVNTILKIRSKVCAAPAFNPGSYTAGCITVSPTSTLDELLQELINQISSVMRDVPRVFDADFVVSPVNAGNLCLGKQISLNGTLTSDRFVAVDNADASPGTLSTKITPGAGISLDTTTTPGTMIVSVDPTFSNDEKVKTSVSDPTAGYLEDKITGSTSVISILTNTVANQVEVSAAIDMTALVTNIIDAITNDTTLKEAFCTLISTCPSACNPPSDITVTYVP